MTGRLSLGVAVTVLLTSCGQAPETVATTTTVPTATTAPTSPTTRAPGVDLVFVGGNVITMDRAIVGGQAVAVHDGKILLVGSDDRVLPLVGDSTAVVDLAGRTLLPGFVDAHSHYFGSLSSLEDQAAMQRIILSYGVTTVAEMAIWPETLERLEAFHATGGLRLRISAYLLGVDACGELLGDWVFDHAPTREWGELLRVGGVKLFADGGSCETPAVSYEYPAGGHGDLHFDSEGLAELISEFDGRGYQVAIHALGDRAVDAALDAYDEVIGGTPNPLRHRIDHVAVTRPEQRSRLGPAGPVAVIFGAFPTCFFIGQDERFKARTPSEVQEWEWAWRDLLDRNPGTVFAWHGDYPVFTDASPLGSLYGFVTRRQVASDGTVCEPEEHHAKHAIGVDEALRAMTMGSAYALDRDTEVGSITGGKLADLVILNADPRAVGDLAELRVEATFVGGRVEWCGVEVPGLCSPEIVEPPPEAGGPPEGVTVTASAATPTEPASGVVDGSLETVWAAGASAPQWIEADLGAETEVTRLRLHVAQYPAGATVHRVFGRSEAGEETLLHEFAGDTAEGDVLEVAPTEPWVIRYVRVETVESPSWVAWYEIEVISTG